MLITVPSKRRGMTRTWESQTVRNVTVKEASMPSYSIATESSRVGSPLLNLFLVLKHVYKPSDRMLENDHISNSDSAMPGSVGCTSLRRSSELPPYAGRAHYQTSHRMSHITRRHGELWNEVSLR